MPKTTNKFFAFALALWVIGVAGFGWILLERKKENQLLYRQQETMNIKLEKLDKLLSGEISPQSFSDDIPRQDYQKELARFKERKITVRPLVFAASTGSMAIGAMPFAWWLLLSIARFVIAGSLRFKGFFANAFRARGHVEEDQLVEDIFAEGEKKYELSKPTAPKASLLAPKSADPDEESEKIGLLYCDKKSLSPKKQEKLSKSKSDLNVKMFDKLEQNIRQTISSGYQQNALKVHDSLKVQNKNLEKQVLEVRQMAQLIKEASLGNSEPVKTSLDELTQQVSAIREYASYQQDRIEKLQEGYDWNIIKTFCLGVIRSLDNLEDRIGRMSEQGVDTTDLEEIKDELIFALESSGVEQFKPEIDSDYRGQEKMAEVVKDKQSTKTRKMKGKIAEVIKPGYRYVIDDENIKIVRKARVKLFG